MTTELSCTESERNQLAHALVHISVALGITEGEQAMSFVEVMFLAEESLKHIRRLNEQYYATRGTKVKDAVPPLG